MEPSGSGTERGEGAARAKRAQRFVRPLWLLAGVAAAFVLAGWLWLGRHRPQVIFGKSLSGQESASIQAIRDVTAKLRLLHFPLRKPGPHDWLANHKETGQTFDEYLGCGPVILEAPRRIIHVQPLGEFALTQRKIVNLTAEFMAVYFNTTVSVRDDLPLSLVPPKYCRAPRGFGPQVHAGCILEDILKPRLPADAAAYIAFTTSDLYPADDWNFVFGEASLSERVGGWSLARYGTPEQAPAAFRLCLLRTIKTATHETGHMFSMQHCILNACNMNGSNHLQEADETPLALCPECLAKLCWATGAQPVEQFRKLAKFCKEQGLEDEAEFYERSLRALER